MTILTYKLNEYIILEVDINNIDNDTLSIWSKAFNTECKIRSRNMSQSTNKTILHMSGIYICLGLWTDEEIKRWWKELNNETLKRRYIKHEMMFMTHNSLETEQEQIRRIEFEYMELQNRKKCSEDQLNKAIRDDISRNNQQCGMIYQAENNSNVTLNSSYISSDDGEETMISCLDIRDRDVHNVEESLSSNDMLSSVENVFDDVSNTFLGNTQITLLGSLSDLSDSMNDLSESTANMIRKYI